jgi:hypothetical protein
MLRFKYEWAPMVMLALVLCGCSGSREIRIPAALPALESAALARQRTPLPEISDWDWRERLITEDELTNLELQDPTMTSSVTHQILARLNSKAEFYIYDDIRKQKPLRVPNDFRAYRNWTPLPQQAETLTHLPRVILVVKDIPFVGWYEHGKRVGDSQVSLGPPSEETEAGVYKIHEKAVDKYSLSYRNDFGEPAWMPWAMRIYGAVWIHAGDVSGPYRSHGCVILPMDLAEELYWWSDAQTTVVIVDSLAKLNQPPTAKIRAAVK